MIQLFIIVFIIMDHCQNVGDGCFFVVVGDGCFTLKSLFLKLRKSEQYLEIRPYFYTC